MSKCDACANIDHAKNDMPCTRNLPCPRCVKLGIVCRRGKDKQEAMWTSVAGGGKQKGVKHGIVFRCLPCHQNQENCELQRPCLRCKENDIEVSHDRGPRIILVCGLLI